MRINDYFSKVILINLDREMNDVEFAQYQADQERYATEATEAATKAAQRQALLTRLGITEDEARLLLG